MAKSRVKENLSLKRFQNYSMVSATAVVVDYRGLTVAERYRTS